MARQAAEREALAQDRAPPETKKERKTFAQVRRAERLYARQLKRVADQIDLIVRGFPLNAPDAVAKITAALARYAELLKPWAEVVGKSLVADVSRRNEQVWQEQAKAMGFAMRDELRRAPTGLVAVAKVAEQVKLITSLPLDAAKRVQELAVGTLYTGDRGEKIVEEIHKTGKVSRARAELIARTEVGRVSSALTQARADYVGSEGYIWRTVRDSDVRNTDGNPIGSHRKLEGKFIRWDDPPVASTDGTRAHAGAIYNCRCYPEVVLPKRI